MYDGSRLIVEGDVEVKARLAISLEQGDTTTTRPILLWFPI
jgi:hypothetical protein